MRPSGPPPPGRRLGQPAARGRERPLDRDREPGPNRSGVPLGAEAGEERDDADPATHGGSIGRPARVARSVGRLRAWVPARLGGPASSRGSAAFAAPYPAKFSDKAHSTANTPGSRVGWWIGPRALFSTWTAVPHARASGADPPAPHLTRFTALFESAVGNAPGSPVAAPSQLRAHRVTRACGSPRGDERGQPRARVGPSQRDRTRCMSMLRAAPRIGGRRARNEASRHHTAGGTMSLLRGLCPSTTKVPGIRYGRIAPPATILS